MKRAFLLVLLLVPAFVYTQRRWVQLRLALRMGRRPYARRWAIVVGGSTGIGLEISALCIQLGYSVLICSRSEEHLSAARRMCRGRARAGGAEVVETAQLDASNAPALDKAIGAFVERHGCPDLLFSCVGKAFPGPVRRESAESLRKALEVNFVCQALPALAVLPHMLHARRGSIVFVSSVSGFMGVTGYTSYAAAKHAVAGFAKTLHNELAGTRVNVSVAFPADTDTDAFHEENRTKPLDTLALSKLGGLLTPAQAAFGIVCGAHTRRLFIASGSARALWAAQRLVPNVFASITRLAVAEIRRRVGQAM
eukprot:gnl/Chilomastix_cuspidata/7008.p1 GENE.gnl/Chilomastix_cuspidata/7008~~gnl/Chilomastix_cuspidata/7008.p1  ORF type:complete len:310 (-),score=65.88 gnl/Chilomastix_cuspidata/7008:321-1250(-)